MTFASEAATSPSSAAPIRASYSATAGRICTPVGMHHHD